MPENPLKTNVRRRFSGWCGSGGLWAIVLAGGLLAGCEKVVSQPLPAHSPSAAESQVFPLSFVRERKCPTGRAGTPFLLHGDAAWSLLVQLDRAQALRYLETRKEQGFNTVLVNLIEHKAAKRPPFNALGDAPFLEATDYSRPNEKYFEHADWVLEQAARLGFLVLLAPSYMGYEGGDEGWYENMRSNGPERLRAYGKYLGSRYKGLPNIVWIHGGDYDPPERRLMQAIVDGIREADPRSVHSFHGKRGTSARGFLGEDTRWLDLNTVYTDENGVVAASEREFVASRLPWLFIEGRYEDMGAAPAVVRAQAWQAMLSGACGQVMGNKYVWPFIEGWENALQSPGARSISVARKLLERLGWTDWTPVFDGLLVGDVGTGALRAASAITADRSRAVIYVPEVRTIDIDVRRLGPSVRVGWIDPVSGAPGPTTRANANDAGLVTLRTPGANSAGDGDWLLILETVRKPGQ